MDINSLVFSNNRSYRVARHSIFWFVWIAYYTVFGTLNLAHKFPLPNRFFSCLIEVCLSTPMDMIFCYSIIYYLLPRFLFKGRYVAMIFLWLLFSVIFMVVFELYSEQVVPVIRGWFGLPKPGRPVSYLWIFFDLFSLINMEGCMAAAIKLGKITFIKQREVDLLRGERISLQAQSDSAKMSPVFLVDIISRFEQMAIRKPAAAPGMIKKIRSLMIYILYENTKPRVSLEKELELINEYIDLEKATGGDIIDVDLAVSNDGGFETIASFILLPCIQNAFKQVSLLSIDCKKIQIRINLINGMLDMATCWSKPPDTSTFGDGNNIILQNLGKRLKLIYPHSHEMKLFIHVEEVMLTLKIDLRQAIN